MVQPTRKNETDELRPYLRAAHLPAPGTLSLDVSEQQMYFSPAELDRLDLQKDDVVIVEGGAGYGRSAYLDDDLDGWGFQNSIVRVRPYPDVSVGRYVYYALQHAQADRQIELEVSTATLPHFTAEKVGRFRLPLPPLETQRAIADYLDRETAEIDGMRADLDEMERLLEERRAAIIDTTITASETTHTVRVGYIAELITGLTYSPQDIVEDGGTVVLRSGNIQSSKINLEDEVQVRLSIPDKLRVRNGDILVCARNGSAKLVGKSAKLTSEEQGFTWGAFMTVVRSDINEWLFWYLHSSEFEHMRGDFSSSTINQLTNGTFSRIPVPVEKDPCRRNELTEELARENAEIDSMLEDITKLRDLLAERRAAVISAAVTGQIDIPVSSTDKDEAHA